MGQPVTVKMKFAGPYADLLRTEGANRRMSMAALATEYAMRGMDAERNDSGELAGFERRMAASILAFRSDLEAVQAEVDTIAAMLDTAVKMLLLHLPEPGGEREALQASALSRHERFSEQVAKNGYEGDRPVAILRIAEHLQSGVPTAKENQ